MTRPKPDPGPPALDDGDEDPDALAGPPVPTDVDLSHLPAAAALAARPDRA